MPQVLLIYVNISYLVYIDHVLIEVYGNFIPCINVLGCHIMISNCIIFAIIKQICCPINFIFDMQIDMGETIAGNQDGSNPIVKRLPTSPQIAINMFFYHI